MIASCLEIMNRAAGMADEMGTFLHAYLREFERAMEEGVADENEVYHYILEQIKKCDDSEIKTNIIDKIEKAQKYRELVNVSEIMKAGTTNLKSIWKIMNQMLFAVLCLKEKQRTK